jgi:hypothetical protein
MPYVQNVIKVQETGEVTSDYATRALAVTAIEAGEHDVAPAGALIRVGGLVWKKTTDATAITDMAGWLPDGDWTPEHFGDTDSTDCSTVFDAASAAAASAGVPLWLAGKTYRGSFSLRNNGVWFGVARKTKLRVHEGAGSSANAAYFNVNETDGRLTDFISDGIRFIGTNSTGAGDCGVLIWGFDNIRFTDCIFEDADTYGFGAESYPGSSRTELQDGLYMTRCGFENNGAGATEYDGLDVKYGTNMFFVDCWATGNSDSGFNLRGEAFISGLRSWDNGTDNVLLQSTAAAGYPSKYQAMNVYSGATTEAAAPGIRVQASSGNPTSINMVAEAEEALGANLQISGSGEVSGVISIHAHDGDSHGVDVTGDYVGNLLIKGLIEGNAGDGVRIAGENVVTDAAIKNNTGVGYREVTGAANNTLAITSIVSNNTAGDITRVGSQTSEGWASALTATSMRLFPAGDTSLDYEASSDNVAMRTSGTATSIGVRTYAKGNGTFSHWTQNGTREAFRATYEGSSIVNYPQVMASLTGNAVRFGAAGSDTDIGVLLQPKGSEYVWMGSHSAIGAETVTGYITIKDAGGTLRKLAVVS